LKEFDVNNDGSIDIDEFQQIGARGILAIDEDFVNKLFDDLDRDKNGTISKAEIELYFGEHPDSKREIDVLRLMKEVDTDGDGVISRDEFRQAMNLRKQEMKQ